MDSYVGPYRIIRLVNRGGQGSVYLGYDKRLHRRVAIKICELPRDRAERKDLLREAQVVASIQSPKVVQIHDVIESGSNLGLVMEYVPGCSLEEYLDVVRPSLASVLRVGADIAGALAQARQQHIVHGDVKAGNILITNTGRAKLTDFGISRATKSGEAAEWRGGSSSALSPEQLRGEPLDERADLFALGCLLYRMLSGEHPFIRGGYFDRNLLLTRRHRSLAEVVDSDVKLPAPLVSLIDQLLEKDPLRRPTSTRPVRQVLRTVVRELPMSTRDSLLQEARPCFRPESPEDLPPQIPEELGQRGRSALAPEGSGIAWVKHWLVSLRWPARAALSLGLVALFCLPMVVVSVSATPVRFDSPVTAIEKGVRLPLGVSHHWMLQQVKEALTEQLGEFNVIGTVGAAPSTVIYSPNRQKRPWAPPEQKIHMDLRCVEELCVFAISRQEKGKRFHRQGVLLPDMPVTQWREVVRDTTLALYR